MISKLPPACFRADKERLILSREIEESEVDIELLEKAKVCLSGGSHRNSLFCVSRSSMEQISWIDQYTRLLINVNECVSMFCKSLFL